MKLYRYPTKRYYKYVLSPVYMDSLPTYASATEATNGKSPLVGSCNISFSPTAVYPCVAKTQNTQLTNSYNYDIIFTIETSCIFK